MATFGEDGSVNGNAGCNGYRGPYTIAGNRITFGSIVSTKRACLSEALTQQETRFLAALGASTTYDLAGDRLTLRDDVGATQVVLVRPSVQPPPARRRARPEPAHHSGLGEDIKLSYYVVPIRRSVSLHSEQDCRSPVRRWR